LPKKVKTPNAKGQNEEKQLTAQARRLTEKGAQRKGKPKGKGQMSKGKSEGDKFTADSHQPAPRLAK
jgi:hypothetical protein